MECILHIGLQKCGSTSLQHWLADNRVALSESGVAVPTCLGTYTQSGFTALCMPYAPNHWIPASTGATSRAEYDNWKAEKTRELKAQIRQARADGSKAVIISQEDLSTLSASSAQTAMEILKSVTDHVRVLCYFRPHADLAASFLSLDARNGVLGDPLKFLDRFRSRAFHAARTWMPHADAFDLVPLARFPDVVVHLCSLLGVDTTAFAPVERQNTALQLHAFDMMTDLQMRWMIGRTPNPNRQIFEAWFPDSDRLRLGRSDIVALNARHAEDVTWALSTFPGLQRSDFESDPAAEGIPEERNFGTRPPPTYVHELRLTIEALNSELWIERADRKLCQAQLRIEQGDLARAGNDVRQARVNLERSQVTRHVPQTDELRDRRDRMDRIIRRTERTIASRKANGN